MATAANLQVLSGGGGYYVAGASLPSTLSSNRGLRVSGTQSKYQDAVMRGRVFAASTASSGVAPGTTISTTAAFSLYNASTSGVNLVILRASMGFVSGTIGSGSVLFTGNITPGAAATTGTAITGRNCYLGAGQVTSAGAALTTATLPGTPVILRPFCCLTQVVVGTTATGIDTVWQDVDGEFIVAPGCTISLQGLAGAGTSPLVVFGMTWEEVPNY